MKYYIFSIVNDVHQILTIQHDAGQKSTHACARTGFALMSHCQECTIGMWNSIVVEWGGAMSIGGLQRTLRVFFRGLVGAPSPARWPHTSTDFAVYI